MNKIFSKNKKKFILILTGVLLIIAAVIGVFVYQNYQRQKELDTYTAQITEYNDSFSNTDDRSEKIEILQNISEDFRTYSKTDSPLDEIIRQYNDGINTMKSCFTSEYEKTLSDHTLDNLEEITDKEQIKTAKTSLSALAETITSETDTVCTEEEALAYTDSINTLIVSYEKRITAIEEQEKKEAEEQARKEAEEKARQEEEARQAAQQTQQTSSSGSCNNSGSSSGGSSGSSSGGSSSSGSSSGGSSGGSTSDGRYQTGTSWYESESGRTEYQEYSDGSWTAQDDQGNSWSSDDLKEWLD